MMQTKKYFTITIILTSILCISLNSSSDTTQDRDNLFNEIFNNEMERIKNLPEYKNAHTLFQSFIADIIAYQTEKFRELQSNPEYITNTTKIREEIAKSGTTHNNELSQAESVQLVNNLNAQFFPQ